MSVMFSIHILFLYTGTSFSHSYYYHNFLLIVAAVIKAITV